MFEERHPCAFKGSRECFRFEFAPRQPEFTFLQVPERQRHVWVERLVAILRVEDVEFRLRKISHASLTIFELRIFLHVDKYHARFETSEAFQFNCEWFDRKRFECRYQF